MQPKIPIKVFLVSTISLMVLWAGTLAIAAYRITKARAVKPCELVLDYQKLPHIPSFWIAMYDEQGKWVWSQRYSGTPQAVESNERK